MSNKTTYKRIALAVVAALGFGVLASGPSNATVAATTLSIAASEATIDVGDTTTVKVTANWANIGTNDSFIVTAIRTEAAGPVVSLEPTIDSVAVTSSDTTSLTSAYAQGTAGSSSKMVFNFRVVTAATAGTYNYTFYPTTDTTGMTASAVTFKLTVVGKDRAIASATSILVAGTNDAAVHKADSTVVASGLVTQTLAGNIFATPVNAAGEKVADVTYFSESITAVITGPGLLRTSVNSTAPTSGNYSRSVQLNAGIDYLWVYSDGTGGVATITLYKGNSSTVLATETVSFSGAAATATLTLGNTVTSKQASDSQTVVRLVIKDSAGQILPSTSDSWYVHSSDTKVVSNATTSTGCLYAYSTATGYATCGLTVGDTGTTKIKVANFAFGTAAASLPTTQVVSGELELRVVGSAASVGLAFDKKTYKPGEQATITLTAKDANGFVVPSQTIADLLVAGIDYSSGTDVTDTTVALTKGVKTYTVNVPTVGGDFIALIEGGEALPAAGQVVSGETVTVVDPAEDAANSALDAAQEATDAAIAATDAAILAQEAADEAAAAATAAQETAQAAVDAVTALSGQVTKLVAQLATLQKLINRIAKKVGVKR